MNAQRSVPKHIPTVLSQNRLLFVGWLIVAIVLVAHHEAWRDEGDTWLMARDASFSQILSIAGHSGTPFAWYLVQMPFAKLGFDFAVQPLLHLAVACWVAYLMCFRAPFALPVKAAFLSSHYLIFEYVAVARNYALGVALSFLAAHLFAHRRAHPFAMGIVLFLLANVSAHFFFFAAAFVAVFALETWRGQSTRAAGIVLIIAGAGLGLALWQLFPRPGGQFPPTIIDHWSFQAPLRAIREAFFPGNTAYSITGPLGMFLLLYMGFSTWRTNWRAGLVLAVCSVGLSYVFAGKYLMGARHSGLFYIAVVMSGWIALREREHGISEGEWHDKHPTYPPWWKDPLRLTIVAVGLGQLSSLGHVWMYIRAEISFPFSNARDAARFFETTGLDRRTVIAHPAPQTSAVLAYLRNARQWWYPSIRAWGSHMRWDAAYMERRDVPIETMLPEIEERFPGLKDDSGRSVLLLLNRPSPVAENNGWVNIYSGKNDAWYIRDENMVIYARADDTAAKLK